MTYILHSIVPNGQRESELGKEELKSSWGGGEKTEDGESEKWRMRVGELLIVRFTHYSPSHRACFLVVDLNEFTKSAGIVIVSSLCIPKSLFIKQKSSV